MIMDMSPVVSALVISGAIGLFFFGIVPGLGAFTVRARWRRFRGTLYDGVVDSTERGGLTIWHGRLSAIEGERTIWLATDTGEIAVDLHKVPVHVLPPSARLTERLELPDESPAVVPWGALGAFAEGTRFLVVGDLDAERRRVRVDRTRALPLVVIYDCPDEVAVERAIWTGRQRNEYWNQLTPVALLGGFLAAVLYAVQVVDSTRLGALLALVVAAIPVLPLIPPGVMGYYVYRRVWRQARRLRAQRDLRYVRQLARGQTLNRIPEPVPRAARLEIAAVLVLLGGIGLNAYLAALVIALVML